MSKSPFFVIQNLLSADECEVLAKKLRVEPSVDSDGHPQAMMRKEPETELVLFDKLKKHIPDVEAHYGIKYRGTENFTFLQSPTSHGKAAEEPHCDNAVYKRKRWIRTNDRDLTGIIWLKDYQDAPPFNITRHVYGGKLEFPVYNFGFQPQAGTCVIFPACERFIYLMSSIQVGELQLGRFHIYGEGTWIYDPADFPGDFRTWFADIV